MDKCIKFEGMLEYLLDDDSQVAKAGRIIRGLLEAQSVRMSQIAEQMEGKSSSCYKVIQRFVEQVDLKQVLLRLYQEEAEYVIGDPTEMPRYDAPKTEYVGKLSDEGRQGYWLLVLSTALRGRAIPFSFITYSSRTLGVQVGSRNQEHFRCFEQVKELLGERPLVLDREFSYLELMQILALEQINFVIRLNLGDKRHPAHFTDDEGRPIKLLVQPGGTVVHRQVYYLGKLPVNVIGFWRKGLSKPLWVVTSLEPERGLEIYQKRMKIEETFRDCKDLLHLTKLMNKHQRLLEQMIALALIAYTLALWLGEAVRDVTYGRILPSQVQQALLGQLDIPMDNHTKWRLYSGLFVLLKQKLRLPQDTLEAILQAATAAFALMAFAIVRSSV